MPLYPHSMFATIRKRRAINSFIRKVGPSLERLYGRKRHYSPDEVRLAGRDVGAPIDFLCYAYCIYCTRADFDCHHQQTGEQCVYDSMRAEVADRHFGGDTSFDVCTVMEAGSSHHDSVGGWFGGGDSHFERAEVAETRFGGDTTFNVGTVTEAGSSQHDSGGGWFGGADSDSDSCSFDDSSGADCGGGDGGGGD